MTDLARSEIRDRVRATFDGLARTLGLTRTTRLVPAHAGARRVVAARGGWLLLADGRPELHVRRVRRTR